ncbi:hypothetical protein C0J52_23566 [Blattella germanica]|nr:hypothetical protein C0J52_23566 [Blattella germanica]
MEKLSNKNWFDKECEKVKESKNETYRKMQQRSTVIPEDQWRKKEREVSKNELIELQELKNKNETRIFYQNLNKSIKVFQPRTILCRNKENTILSDIMRYLKDENNTLVSFITLMRDKSTTARHE